MKTDGLIARPAREPPQPSLRLPTKAFLILGAIALSSGIFLHMAGVRPNLADALRQPFRLLGTALLLIACGLSTSLLLRLTRPEAPMRFFVMAFPALVVTTNSVEAAATLISDPVAGHAEVDLRQAVEAIFVSSDVVDYSSLHQRQPCKKQSDLLSWGVGCTCWPDIFYGCRCGVFSAFFVQRSHYFLPVDWLDNIDRDGRHGSLWGQGSAMVGLEVPCW